ncbi:HMP-PP phosphatase [Pluralibacter gergoviae]|uniref:HMP-PP phosphatase n=1 Tax=Pluralibacter gergoviae TaxID=61647 RepID=A0AAW8HNY9_PLUGE|nr:HMP-PP phosphatase [Pluralibacter gergoviae]AVR03129.1 HMP-PP phosphatase [Pluralibacter gergoviae]KMK03938.1 thiamin pyrimidine pyrophosphate hydrolase [Pluralibacter gergoviae]KMK28377.1 thiamin pyrimidine pyrophosphate hydrolase [Pluralibacter gergoviae]MDQ2310167.1 HMP-PP phosphatase [Pluralibacter gergoviae]SUB72911.1 HMP-PP phosphatase [Pluralibacter gergoviae]
MAKLAAFDMDGTLLMPDHRLGEQTLRALGRLQASGVTLAFATGRHTLEMRYLMRDLDLDAYLIAGNGTRVHARDGAVLHRCDLAPDVAEAVLHSRWDTPATLHVFNDDGWFTDRAAPALLEAHGFSDFRYQLRPLKAIPAHEVTKICFCGDREALTRLRIQLNDAIGGRADICFSAVDCLEILPAGCNKGSALAKLGEHLGVSLDECMAFGDAMNDSEMLGAVGRGLIMGNAMPQLRAALPHLPVIGHCRGQAVAHYLNHWLDTPHLPYSPE